MRNTSTVLTSMMLCQTFLSSMQAQSSTVPKATLYSPNKYRTERRVACLNFETGPTASRSAHCDLRYGALWVGSDLDWFETGMAEGDRSVIKHLGSYEWTGRFEIPIVEPLPKLKPGERRTISIDASGADGAPGRPGRNGADADANSGDFRGEKSPGDMPGPPNAIPEASTPTVRPRQDGKPKIDPAFVKAIAGHLYVIHIVDEARDFYALFRVEALERGDNCTVSWRLIPHPVSQ